MAEAEQAKPSDNDATLLAVEATEPEPTEPVILQEPDRTAADFDTPVQTVTPSVPVKSAKRQSGVLPFILGGALLAGAGFATAKYAFPDTSSVDAIAALQAQLDAKQANDATLQSELASLSARPAPDSTLSARLTALEAQIKAGPDTAAFVDRLTALENRLMAIEAVSAGGEGAPAAALAAMNGQIDTLKAAIAAQQGAGTAAAADIEAASAAVQTRLDAAEAAASLAAKQAALSHIRAAFESGAPLGPAVDSLKSLGADVPAVLVSAADGVPSVIALQDGFSAPARAALDASIRADMGEGWANRLTSFLRAQSGARSLTPHAGTDPDAVLSRAEAALRDGQIKVAVTELAGLPPAGADLMKPWISDATRRLDTEQAIFDLSATLNGQ